MRRLDEGGGVDLSAGELDQLALVAVDGRDRTSAEVLARAATTLLWDS
jgi:hypothetical protein